MQAEYQTILDYWFSREEDEETIMKQQSSLWWGKSKEIDEEIKRSFGLILEAIEQGQLEEWKVEPRSRLAMVIVTDQFSRQIYRNHAKAFASDPLALELCLGGVESGMDKELRYIERVFFYMPMEHSESLTIQRQCVALFEELLEEVEGRLKSAFEGYLSFAQSHLEIIERFGRFPHRNEILSRASTAEEQVFLTQPNSSF